MTSMDHPVRADEEAVDYDALRATLRRGWWIIAIFVIGAVLAVVVYLHSATYSYTSTVVVTPAQYSRADGLSGKLGGLGGLASAVGVSLPDGNGTSEFKLYIEGLRSYDVAKQLAADPRFMHRLFSREWDPVVRQWRMPRGASRNVINSVKDILGIPNIPYQPPNAIRLQTLLDEKLMVDVNPRSPVVTIRFAHEDPTFGNEVLERINGATDNLLRQRALLRTNDYIRYLTAKLPVVQMPEQKLSIAQTLGDQERIKMAASSTRPYAGEIFSGPAASFRPTSPKPYKLLLIGMLLGAGLGIAVVLQRGRRRALPVTA